MAESPDQQAESLPRCDDSPSLFDPETPERATRVTRQLFGAVEKSPGMTPSSPDSAYASRPMESNAAQWTTPAASEYQTPNTGTSASTLAPSLTTERAEKSEQTPELPRKGRQASPSPRSSPKESQRSQSRRETAHDDDRYGKEATAPRRKAQSTPSTRKSRGSSRSKSSTPKQARERLQWNDLADSNTEENGSSAENDEQKVSLSRRNSRRSLSNRMSQSSLRANSSSSSSSESSIQSTRRERRIREIAKPEKKDEQTDILKKQMAELQKQLAESAEQPALALLSTGSESAKRLNITEESSDVQDRYSPLTSVGLLTTGPHQRSERKY